MLVNSDTKCEESAVSTLIPKADMMKLGHGGRNSNSVFMETAGWGKVQTKIPYLWITLVPYHTLLHLLSKLDITPSHEQRISISVPIALTIRLAQSNDGRTLRPQLAPALGNMLSVIYFDAMWSIIFENEIKRSHCNHVCRVILGIVSYRRWWS